MGAVFSKPCDKLCIDGQRFMIVLNNLNDSLRK